MAADPPAPRDRAHHLALAVAALVPVLIGLLAARLTAASTVWVTPFIAVVSVAIGVASLATIVAVARRTTWPRAAIPAILLGGLPPFIVACRLDASPLHLASFPSLGHALTVGGITTLAVVGLAARRMWGRWLGLAVGATAIGSGVLNAIAFAPATRAFDAAHPAWSITMFETEWAQLTSAAVGVIIIVNLATAGRAFAVGRAHPAWTSDAPVIRSVRLLIVAALTAMPMLLVYAFVQPIGPATRASAMVLAALLGAGAFAAVRGQVIGVLTLSVAGLGLLAQTAATYFGATTAATRHVASYYAVFWLPAAAIAIAASLRMVGPTRRILRRPDPAGGAT